MDRVRHVRPATKATLRASLLAAAAGAVVMVPQLAGAATESENFTVAPSDWIGLDNDGSTWGPYGHSDTDNTGGASPAGEAGGTFLRTNVRNYYADRTIGTLSHLDTFSATGEIFVSAPSADNDVILGHFAAPPQGATAEELNHGGILLRESSATEWRFMARIRGDGTNQKDGNVHVVPNGNYSFSYNYDPIARTMTASLFPIGGGAPLFTSTTPPLDVGETFVGNSFGWTGGFSGAGAGQFMTAFMDGVNYTIGQAANQNFDTSPRNWFKQGGVGPGNYGFSNTNNTAQESGAGEAGGLINRDDIRRAYADGTVGQITQANPFSASGEFSWGNAQNQNTENFIAHYAQDQVDGVNLGDSNLPTEGGHNMAGLYVLDESENSIRVRARVYTANGTRRDGPDFSVAPGQYKFDYSYDPNSLTLTVRILQQDGATVFGSSSVVLDPADQLSLDAFGLTTGFTGSPAFPPQSYDLFIDGVTYTINPGTRWTDTANANWSAAAWSHGVPNAVGAVANFGDAISSNVTVTNDSANTVGTINFDDNNSYTIDGANTLTIANSGIGGSINVVNGNHSITAPVAPAGNLVVNVAPTSTLTVSNLQPTAGEVIKNGDGKWAVNNVQAASLAVSGGVVELMPGSAGASRVSNLIVNTGGRLDMKDNKLIVAAANQTGTWTGSAYDGVSGLVDSGRGDAGNAQWNGTTGIITSDTRAINNGDLVSIGVAKVSEVRTVTDSDTTTFAGQTVLGSDTLVMATWGGDANLDGKINIDDYGRIDGNVGQSGSVFGWSRGDFNYDGKINIDDYGIIDGNINRQGTPFSTAASLEGVAAVPEPTALLLAGPVALGALLRRRRR